MVSILLLRDHSPAGGVKGPGGHQQNSVFLTWPDAALMNSQPLWLPAQARYHSSTEWKGSWVPTLTLELQVVDGFWERESPFPLWVWLLPGWWSTGWPHTGVMNTHSRVNGLLKQKKIQNWRWVEVDLGEVKGRRWWGRNMIKIHSKKFSEI